MDERPGNKLRYNRSPVSRYHQSASSSLHPPQGTGSVPALGAQARTGGEPAPPSTPHSGLAAARTAQRLRTPGPTPYLGRERKEQQQRAGRRRHRAQRLLFQSQHVLEAPLAGDPQPGQHLRGRNRAARQVAGTYREAGEAGRALRPRASPRAWEEPSPAPPPTRAECNDTAQSAAHTWLPRRPGLASGRSLLHPTSDRFRSHRRTRGRGRGWAPRPRPSPAASGARRAPLGLCETAGAGGRLRLGAPGGGGQRKPETSLTLFSIWKANAKIKAVIDTATW